MTQKPSSTIRRLRWPACACTVALAAAGAAETPAADALVARHAEARGGLEAIADLTAVRAAGTFEVPMMEGPVPFTQAQQRPDKLRFQVGMGERREVQVTDGATNWVRDGETGEVTETPVAVARRYLRQASLDGPLLFAHRQGVALRSLGREMRDGVETHVLAGTWPNGDRTRFFLHPETYLLVATEDVWQIRDDEAVVVSRFADHRPVAGVLMPHRVEQETSQGWRRIVFETIEPVDDLPPSTFARPD